MLPHDSATILRTLMATFYWSSLSALACACLLLADGWWIPKRLESRFREFRTYRAQSPGRVRRRRGVYKNVGTLVGGLEDCWDLREMRGARGVYEYTAVALPLGGDRS